MRTLAPAAEANCSTRQTLRSCSASAATATTSCASAIIAGSRQAMRDPGPSRSASVRGSVSSIFATRATRQQSSARHRPPSSPKRRGARPTRPRSCVGWAHTLCRWFQLDLLKDTEFEQAHPKAEALPLRDPSNPPRPQPANLDSLAQTLAMEPAPPHRRTTPPHHEHPHTTPDLTTSRPEQPATRPNTRPGYLTDPTHQSEQPSPHRTDGRQHPRPAPSTPPPPEALPVTPKQPSDRHHQ